MQLGCRMQGEEVTAHLHDGWAATDARPGDPVHLIAPIDRSDASGPHAHVSHRDGLLILHPDVLLSGEHPFACSTGTLACLKCAYCKGYMCLW